MLAVVASSCSGDDASAPDTTPATESVNIRFSIDMRSLVPGNNPGSRAAVEMPANTLVGNASENFLDLEHITFLIFDSDRRLISILHPDVTPQVGTDYVRYDVQCTIDDEYFTNPASSYVNFYIMVLANYHGYSPEGMYFTRGQTMQNIFNVSQPSFAIPDASPWWFPHYNTLDPSSGVYPASPQYIPMSGLQYFSVRAADLQRGNVNLPDDIYMLRSMAKIEVIDRIDAVGEGASTVQPPVDQRASIEKVELMGFFSRGTLLPSYSEWNDPATGIPSTRYTHTPFVPAHIPFVNPTAFGSDQSIAHNLRRYFGEDELATAARADGCRVFSVYVPEITTPAPDQPLVPGTAPAPARNVWIEVTVQNPPEFNGGNLVSVLYELRLVDYVDGTPSDNATSILRNNIYRYEIVSVSSSLVGVVWTVCPMYTAPDINIPGFN